MSHVNRVIVTAASLWMGITCSVFGEASQNGGSMQQELAALKARIAELEATKNEAWMSKRRAEEVKTLIHEVLSDADTRASLLGNGAVAGHDGKQFFLASEDGRFVLKVKGQVQMRYIYNNRESTASSPAGFDEHEFGFQLRRAKITFAGQIGSPKFTYSVGLQTDRNDETVELDHAYFGYRVADNVVLFGGESKAPFLREEITSSSKQLTVERSLTNEIFSAGRVQGIWAAIEADDNTHVTVAITDGANSGEAGGTKDFHNDTSDFAFTARVDLRLAGEWSQMKDFTAWSGEQQAVFVGAAVHYELSETGGIGSQPALAAGTLFNPTMAAIAVDDFWTWTVDGSIESNGMNLFASLSGVHFNSVNGGSDVDAYGLVVQGGYMLIPDTLEPFVRWEWIDPDVRHSMNLVTVGANYYLKKHAAKFTADLVWALNSLDSASSSGLGLLPDTSGETDQMAIRAQFQLLF